MARDRLSPKQAKENAALFWSRGWAIITPHCQRRMDERNVSFNDITYLLNHGEVVDDKSVYDDENMAWEYFIAGVDIDGVALAAIFSIDSEDSEITLITVRDI